MNEKQNNITIDKDYLKSLLVSMGQKEINLEKRFNKAIENINSFIDSKSFNISFSNDNIKTTIKNVSFEKVINNNDTLKQIENGLNDDLIVNQKINQLAFKKLVKNTYRSEQKIEDNINNIIKQLEDKQKLIKTL